MESIINKEREIDSEPKEEENTAPVTTVAISTDTSSSSVDTDDGTDETDRGTTIDDSDIGRWADEVENEIQIDSINGTPLLLDNPIAEDLMNIIGISKKEAKNVKIFNQFLDLYLLHYTRCRNDSPDILKKIRGIIVCLKQKKIVCQSLPYTTELLPAQVNKTYFTKKIERIYSFREGTILRLFYYDGWKVSTHHRISASSSTWSTHINNTKNFNDMFEECCREENFDLNNLNKDWCYVVFMIHHNNTVICTNQPRYAINFVAAYDVTQNMRFIKNEEIIENPVPGMSYPGMDELQTTERIVKSNNREEIAVLLSKKAESINRKDAGGLMIIFEDGTSLKIMNSKYKSYLEAKGNEPLVLARYIQIRMSLPFSSSSRARERRMEEKSEVRQKYEQNLRKFMKLYPNQKDKFYDMDVKLCSISKILYSHFISRFVRGEYRSLEAKTYRFLRGIYEKYKHDLDDVMQETIDGELSCVNARELYQYIEENMTNKKRREKRF